MIRLRHFATVSALLLLAGTPITTLASHDTVLKERHSGAIQSTSMATAMHYFKALQPQGHSSHDYQALARLYDPGVALTESLSTGRPVFHVGLTQMRAFDALNSLSWLVLTAEQLSATVVLATERPFTLGPGHELEHGVTWSTRLTVRNGTIVNLVWRPVGQPIQPRRHAMLRSIPPTK